MNNTCKNLSAGLFPVRLAALPTPTARGTSNTEHMCDEAVGRDSGGKSKAHRANPHEGRGRCLEAPTSRWRVQDIGYKVIDYHSVDVPCHEHDKENMTGV